MKFSCIEQQNGNIYAYKLQIQEKEILFAGGVDFQSIFNYLPSQGMQENIQKHVKMEQEQKQNPYMHQIFEKNYIRGPLKFNFAWLQNINIQKLSIWCISSLDDIYLLPFLASHPSFTGQILTTIPINQIGYYIVKDFQRLIQDRDKAFVPIDGEFWEENQFYDFFEHNYQLFIQEWIEIFTLEQIEKSFEKVIQLGYKQQFKSECDLIIEPCSSGYSIGSAFWIIQYQNQKIVVIMNISQQKQRYTSNFDLERLQSLSNKQDKISALIVADCFQEQNDNLSLLQQEQNVKFFTDTINENLKQNPLSNFLLPMKSFQTFLDLVFIIKSQLKSVKFFIVGDHFNAMFKYSNANIEFLNQILQNKIYSKQPEIPFSNLDSLIKEGIITNFSSIFDLIEHNKNRNFQQLIQINSPCIYVILDPVLRFGLGEKFINILEQFQGKTVILTEFSLQQPEIFKPFKKNSTAKVLYCPLDFRSTFQQFNEILKKIDYKNLALPIKYKSNDKRNQYYQQGNEIIIKIAFNQGNQFHLENQIENWKKFGDLKIQYGEIQFRQNKINFLPLQQNFNLKGYKFQTQNMQIQNLQQQIVNYFKTNQLYISEYYNLNDKIFFRDRDKIYLVIELKQNKAIIFSDLKIFKDVIQIMQNCLEIIT